jgi:hypothetical protein
LADLLGTIGGLIKYPEGKIILILTLACTVFCLASLVLYLTVPDKLSNVFLTIGGCLASGWGITVLLWLLGFIWDILTVNSSLKGIGRPGSNEEGIAPGAGLWVGLVVAAGVVAVFSTLLALRRQALWLYLGEGCGLLLGILLVAVNVQPWDTGVDNNKVRADQSLIAKHKIRTRYLPLLSNWKTLQP